MIKRCQFLSRGFFYFWVFISAVPLLLLVLISVSIFWPYPALFPETISFEYYGRLLVNNPRTWEAIQTSILLAIFVSLITLVIAIPAGKALVHYQFFGKKIVKALVLIPLVVPSMAVTMGIQVSMIRLGLSGTFFGVALVHALFTLPYAIRIMSNVFELVGNKLESQATVLGAGAIFIFRRVTLPQIMPGILAAATISFTISIAQYITTFIVGGGRVVTVTMLLLPHIQGGESHVVAIYSLLLVGVSLISLTLMEYVLRRYYRLENVAYM